ncbi:hypothetical protein ACFOZ0_27475 [Streptomyces yaanensis]|uniref:Uncharacterized protein n=1 Tax=Streptomyces yaanensis TaxID=1142239 RepID=A0ABV7SKZ0_9ACTN|nr:hypothetical protein [Streptomyces sp. CGMCC 4.7035]WNB97038.1 hypothetical protein Q2K21_02540 [Streptomyces sp. CGMCC 4.7035]
MEKSELLTDLDMANTPTRTESVMKKLPEVTTAGDFLTKPVAKGGLDLGTAGSSAILLAVLLGLTAYAQVEERRTVTASAKTATASAKEERESVTRQEG